MSWLNQPVEIVESIRIQREQQFMVSTKVFVRWRKITWTRSRWVGGNKTSAEAKANQYLKNNDAETEVVRVGEGGQYQAIVTICEKGAWSEWSEYMTPPTAK